MDTITYFDFDIIDALNKSPILSPFSFVLPFALTIPLFCKFISYNELSKFN